MSTLNITIPDSIRSRLERCAKEEGVSMDAFVASVLSQRVAVADADSYVRERAERGSAESLIQLLDKAPDNEPEPGDRIIGKGE